MSDNLAASFDTVPKLSAKESYVVWNQRITLAFALTRSSHLMTERPTTPAPPYSLATAFPG